MNILTLTEISKIYGDLKALDKINLTVEEGEWLSIMGPSGSGKTTLMNIIGCMDKPSLGKIDLAGQDISKLSSKELTIVRRDMIGLVFQQFHLVNYLTALESVGLKERAKHLPNQLSGGEQQRVCIARALINHPKLLLADEPTGNLDEKNEKLVMEIFEKLHNAGSTIIVVTHDPEVADQAERMVVLEHGKIARIEKMSRVRPSRGENV